MTTSTERAPGRDASSLHKDEVLGAVAGAIVAIRCGHPVRVAIDGVDAAGKSMFADELAATLRAGCDRTIVRASIDGFHNPRSVRLARGPDAPDGYYYDSFDLDALIRGLLLPLGAGGERRIRTRVFNFETDTVIASADQLVAVDSILVFDGVFLLRPELRPFWEFSIFLDVPFEVTVARAVERDGYLFGNAEQIRRRYARRYVPGQKLYLQESRPQSYASVVIDNSDFERPMLVKNHQPLSFTLP